MGNGASLLSPGKRRAQQQQPLRANEAVATRAKADAPTPTPSSVGVVTSDATAKVASSASTDVNKTHEGPEDVEADHAGDEGDAMASEDLPSRVDDVVAFLRSQQLGDTYTDFTLALALELEQDYDAARYGLIVSFRHAPCSHSRVGWFVCQSLSEAGCFVRCLSIAAWDSRRTTTSLCVCCWRHRDCQLAITTTTAVGAPTKLVERTKSFGVWSAWRVQRAPPKTMMRPGISSYVTARWHDMAVQ